MSAKMSLLSLPIALAPSWYTLKAYPVAVVQSTGDLFQPSGPPVTIKGQRMIPFEGGHLPVDACRCATRKDTAFNPGLRVIDLDDKQSRRRCRDTPRWHTSAEHVQFRRDLAEGFYIHGYTPRHVREENPFYKDVCLIDALRKLGYKVEYQLDGPFWGKRHGDAFLLPFGKKLVVVDGPGYDQRGSYVVRTGEEEHFVAVRVFVF